LLDTFGDLEQAWHASPGALRGAGLGPKTIDSILKVRSSLDLPKEVKRLHLLDIHLTTLLADDYPDTLKHIHGPPAFLFIRGELRSTDEVAVAVVGTRRATGYGRRVTQRIVSELAAASITIISGLALGIDGAAHEAAIEAGGRTVAVLGSGIDHIYPAQHRSLANHVEQCGALVSEYPPGRAPEGHHFPARNRIIAGLAKAVIVIEAAERSGALITADFAADQGKDVFAVPGDISRIASRGTNRLIQDGAFPLLDPADVIDTLECNPAFSISDISEDLTENRTEHGVLECLGADALHIDEIHERSGIPIPELQAALSMLELRGVISSVGSMQYMRVREKMTRYEVD
jgi:DNA processing protein